MAAEVFGWIGTAGRAEAIAVGEFADLADRTDDAATGVVDALAALANLSLAAIAIFARIALALAEVADFACLARDASARIGFALTFDAILACWALDAGADGDAGTVFTRLAFWASDAGARMSGTLAIATDLSIGARFAVAIVLNAFAVDTDVGFIGGANDPEAGVDADAVSADFTGIAFDFAATLSADAFAVLADLTSGTFVDALVDATAIIAKSRATAGCAIVDFSVAIVIDAIADFGSGIRSRADRPVAGNARCDAFSAGSFARLGDRLLGTRDVVDESVAIVIDTIADLGARRDGFDGDIGDVGGDLGIEGAHGDFDFDPRIVGGIDGVAIVEGSAPSSALQSGFGSGGAGAHGDRGALGSIAIPRDLGPLRQTGSVCGAAPVALGWIGERLEGKARHIGVCVRPRTTGVVFADRLACFGVDFGSEIFAIRDDPDKTVGIHGYADRMLTDICKAP